MRIDVHVQDICCKACIDTWHISSIHHLLSIDMTKALLSGFVLPKLVYCKSLFYGSWRYMLERLQKVQNSAARLVFKCHKQNHISPLLMSLHWLPLRPAWNTSSQLSVSLFRLVSYLLVWSTLILHTQKKNYALSLTSEFYVSLNCE